METLEFETKRAKIAPYCPCGKDNRDGKFAPFKGYTNKGYCHSCEKSFFDESQTTEQYFKPLPQPPTEFLKRDLVDKSITGQNNFITYLRSIFDDTTVQSLTDTYRIGTTKRFKDGVVFWYIDRFGNVRSGKAMGYNTNGRRRKDPPQVHWVHSILKLQNYKYNACLFGSHLLTNGSKTSISVVESEKTAIIASAYLPQFTWVATGGKQNLRRKLFECIKDRQIILYPDKGCVDDWQQTATKELKGFNWSVSDVLEDWDCEKGADIADVLVQQPYNNPTTTLNQSNNNRVTTEKQLKNNPTLEAWDSIEELPSDWSAEEWEEVSQVYSPNTGVLKDVWDIESISISTGSNALPNSLKLASGEVITNLKGFIESHTAIIKAQNGRKAYLPYYKRLRQVVELINTNN